MDHIMGQTMKKNIEAKFSAETAQKRWAEILLIIAIFAIAFSIRLAYLEQIKTGPIFAPSRATQDEYLYDNWAKEIAFRDPVGKEVFWGLPLYPYLVAIFYFIFGTGVYIVKFLHFAAGALNSVLLYFIGKKLFNRPVAVLSALILAFYNADIFYEGFLISTVFGILLNCILFLSIFAFGERPDYKKAASLGLILGLNGLITPGVFLFIPFLIFTFLRYRKYLAVSLIFGMLVILPVTVRNYVVAKDFIPISAHAGITFYSGNNPDADGTFKLPAYLGTDVQTIKENSTAIAEKTMGKGLKPSEVSGFWFRMAFEYIDKHPLEYTKLLFKKFLLFWNHHELSDIFDMKFFQRYSGILKLPLVNFAFISVFSLLGIVLSLKSTNQNVRLALFFILCNMVSLLMYFVNSRYRMATVPFLIVFSAFGLYRLYCAVREKRYRFFILCMAGCAVFYFFGNIKLIPPSEEIPYTNLAVFYQSKGMYEEAVQEYNNAFKINPDYPLAHNNLGILYNEIGQTEKAAEEYKKAIAANRNYPTPYFNLGLLYFKNGDYAESIKYFEDALSLNPSLIKAHNYLGRAYMALQNKDKAFEHLNISIGLNPDQPDIEALINSL